MLNLLKKNNRYKVRLLKNLRNKRNLKEWNNPIVNQIIIVKDMKK